MHVSPTFFPALNAFLNGSSAVLIGTAYYFIKSGRRQAHKRMMISAFATSCLFLTSYLYYHLVLRAGVTRFRGEGMSRQKRESRRRPRPPQWDGRHRTSARRPRPSAAEFRG